MLLYLYQEDPELDTEVNPEVDLPASRLPPSPPPPPSPLSPGRTE